MIKKITRFLVRSYIAMVWIVFNTGSFFIVSYTLFSGNPYFKAAYDGSPSSYGAFLIFFIIIDWLLLFIYRKGVFPFFKTYFSEYIKRGDKE